MNIKKNKTLEDFKDMEQLELKYYSEEHVTPHEEAYRWHLSNPNTGFVLEDGGRIVGFTDILPVREEIFTRIAAGTFNDKYLTAEDLVSMDGVKEGDTINLLLSCVLIDEDYRETDALKILLAAHLDYYRSFENKGIMIGTVLTSNVTRDGERFSERMGFERIGRSHHQTTLYRVPFDQLVRQVNLMKSRLEGRLLEYEYDFQDPGFCMDAARLDSRIASDFKEYGQSGTIYNRDDMIRVLSLEKRREIEISDFHVRCLSGHAAVAHYTAVRKDSNDPEGSTSGRSLRTSLWIKEEGQWKLFFHQGTSAK